MKRFAIAIMLIALFGCAHQGAVSGNREEEVKVYSATAVSLSDFSMKIVAYYQSQSMAIPNDFDAAQFFSLLEKIYPDQSRVRFIKDSYLVSVRRIERGYSVMLCDPQSNRKVMEDLSCHLDRVEIRSWERETLLPCAFEVDWRPQCN